MPRIKLLTYTPEESRRDSTIRAISFQSNRIIEMNQCEQYTVVSLEKIESDTMAKLPIVQVFVIETIEEIEDIIREAKKVKREEREEFSNPGKVRVKAYRRFSRSNPDSLRRNELSSNLAEYGDKIITAMKEIYAESIKPVGVGVPTNLIQDKLDEFIKQVENEPNAEPENFSIDSAMKVMKDACEKGMETANAQSASSAPWKAVLIGTRVLQADGITRDLLPGEIAQLKADGWDYKQVLQSDRDRLRAHE